MRYIPNFFHNMIICFVVYFELPNSPLLHETLSDRFPLYQSKPVTPRRRWGTPTEASAVMVAHRRLSSATLYGVVYHDKSGSYNS